MSIFSQTDVAAYKVGAGLFIKQFLPGGVWPSDAFILMQLQAAEADVAAKLRVFLQPTQVYSYEPSEAEVSALAGKPYFVEPGYDYDDDFFSGERWGYIVTRNRPIIAVQAIQFVYPAPQQTVYKIPLDWLRLDKKYATIRLVPASSTFVAPLGAFLLQALGGGRTIPGMLQVTYTAGLQTTDPIYPAVLDAVYKTAGLKLFQGAFVPGSQSISADGLSQSKSFDPQKFQDSLDQLIFGPKGSNGGLFTAINGVVNSMAGVIV